MLREFYTKLEAKHRLRFNKTGRSSFHRDRSALFKGPVRSLSRIWDFFVGGTLVSLNFGIFFAAIFSIIGLSGGPAMFMAGLPLGFALVFGAYSFKLRNHTWPLVHSGPGNALPVDAHKLFTELSQLANSEHLRDDPMVKRNLVAAATLTDQLILDYQDWFASSSKDSPDFKLTLALEDSEEGASLKYPILDRFSGVNAEFKAQLKTLELVKSSFEDLISDRAEEAANLKALELLGQVGDDHHLLPSSTRAAATNLSTELESLQELRLSSNTARQELHDYVEAATRLSA